MQVDQSGGGGRVSEAGSKTARPVIRDLLDLKFAATSLSRSRSTIGLHRLADRLTAGRPVCSAASGVQGPLVARVDSAPSWALGTRMTLLLCQAVSAARFGTSSALVWTRASTVGGLGGVGTSWW